MKDISEKANKAAQIVANASTSAKNAALLKMAKLLEDSTEDLLKANQKDLDAARDKGLPQNLLDRLVFGESKIKSRINSLKKIASLPDPVGQVKDLKKTDIGLVVGRMRVPMGVILMIYEARPHVTVNAGAFALKSGNTIICKGGSEAENCNGLLGRLWAEALDEADLPPDSVQVVSLSHDEVDKLLQKPDEIAVVIPRGGKELIRSVSEKSRIPVIKHFEGVCHVYIGESADKKKAISIALDSKLLMPEVCNAAETVLVDKSMVDFLPELGAVLKKHGVEIRGCPIVCEKVDGAKTATEEDWHAEYLDKIYSIKVVDGVDEAITHISKYGSGHTETIVTEHYSDAQKFLRETDSSVVLVNASTMYCDGESLGMGAEIGISTDKFHARGPMGLEELTTYKFVIWGDGQVMGDEFKNL